MKGLKLALKIVLAVLVLVILAAVAVVATFDPNDYKAQIKAAAKEQTGRELTLAGPLELSLFPWLGLELNKVSLANAQGFDGRPFAAIERADVSVAVLPLLRREIEIDTIRLHGLDLDLQRRADGSTNWDDLVQRFSGEKEPVRAESGDATGAGLAVLVGGVDLREASVHWRDARAGTEVTVAPIDLETGTIRPGEPVDIKLGLGLENREPRIEARLDLEAVVEASADFQRLTVTGLETRLEASGAAIPADSARLELATPTIEFDNGSGDVVIRELTAELLAEGGELPVAGHPLRLATTLRANLQRETASVENLELTGLETRLSGGATATGVLSDPRFQGQLQLHELDPRALLERLAIEPPASRDPDVLARLAARTDFQGSTTAVRLENLDLALDDSRLTGELEIKDFATRALRFDLALDAIDVDRYLPPAPEEPEQAEAKPAGAPIPVALPVEVLRELDVQGRLTVGKLVASGLTLSEISIDISAEDGVVAADPINASLYEGLFKGATRVDVREDTPVFHLRETLTGLATGPLLEDLTGDDKLQGTGRVESDLTTRGQTVDALKSGLNGDLAFAFTDGAVKGFNLAAAIRKARARIAGQPLPEEAEEQKTDFSQLTGSASITDGVVKNRDLQAKSPFLRVKGEGDIDLGRERLDYLLTTTIVATPKGQGGAELEELKGVPIPVRIKGPFSDPKPSVDLASVLEEQQKARIEKKVEEKKEELREKLKEKLVPKGREGEEERPEDQLKKKLMEGLGL